MDVFQVFSIVQMVPNRAKRQIFSSVPVISILPLKMFAIENIAQFTANKTITISNGSKKQPFPSCLLSRYSQNSCKTGKKTSMPESILNKVVGL